MTAPTQIDALADLVKLLGQQPPAKWVLVAPDGRVWASPDPMVLARVCTLNSDFLPLLREKLHDEYASGLDSPPL